MTGLSKTEAVQRGKGTAMADDVRLYLEVAAEEPLLSKTEEVDLAVTIERGKEAEEKLRLGRFRSPKTQRRARDEVAAGE